MTISMADQQTEDREREELVSELRALADERKEDRPLEELVTLLAGPPPTNTSRMYDVYVQNFGSPHVQHFSMYSSHPLTLRNGQIGRWADRAVDGVHMLLDKVALFEHMDDGTFRREHDRREGSNHILEMDTPAPEPWD